MPTIIEYTLLAPVELTASTMGTANVVASVSQLLSLGASATATSTAELDNRVTFPFTGAPLPFVGTTTLASEELAAAETRLGTVFPTPYLEDLRKRCLRELSASTDLATKARAVTLGVYSTELSSVFNDLLNVTKPTVIVRDPYAVNLGTADKALAITASYIDKAFSELATLGLPRAYIDLLSGYQASSSFVHRIAARCAMVLLAAILLAEQKR